MLKRQYCAFMHHDEDSQSAMLAQNGPNHLKFKPFDLALVVDAISLLF